VAQAQQIFDESFLSIRAKLIEVAAMLDRIDRANAEANCDPARTASDIDSDPRRQRVEEAIDLLLKSNAQPGQRAATLQLLFSRQYDPKWRDQLEV
jgi:hypothetical protein